MSSAVLLSLLALPSVMALAIDPAASSGSGGRIALSKRESPAKIAARKSGIVDKDHLKAMLDRHQRKWGNKNGTATLTRRATGSTALIDQDDTMWTGKITVGGQTFSVDFDTGSSDLWVPSSTCTGAGCTGHAKYKLSSTGKLVSKGTFSIEYGDGSSTSGDAMTDTVGLGGLTATGQAFAAATSMSSGFDLESYPADGLLGLAFQSLSELGKPPFFQTLVAQKAVTSPVFAFKLTETGSELYLGGVDSSLYTGAITYAPVSTEEFWTIAMDAVKVGTTTLASLTGKYAVIDTGTTLIYGPTRDVTKLYAAIPGSVTANSILGSGYPGMHAFPCSASPSPSLTFGGKAFAISADQFNLGTAEDGSDYCIGAIVGDSAANLPYSNAWLVGDAFLSNVYSVFDVGNSRVGFAALK